MVKKRDLFELAGNYHNALPRRIREYLNKRGIPDSLISFYSLGWNGWRITIPVFNRQGALVFFRLAKSPFSAPNEPKMLASSGSYVELYGWSQVLSKPDEIIICEGEFDRLVLESQEFSSVTSTGGAGIFRREWVKDFEPIPKVYVCFDNDDAGRSGALKVGRMIPHAKLIELPQDVGKGGDVTDFFVRLAKSKEEFRKLMEEGKPAPPLPPQPAFTFPARHSGFNYLPDDRVERIKAEVPIARLIGRYVQLRHAGENYTGLCPFHEDHQPSLTVYPATGTFHCFGCRERGDVIAFLMKIEKLAFRQALDVFDQIRSNHERKTERNN